MGLSWSRRCPLHEGRGELWIFEALRSRHCQENFLRAFFYYEASARLFLDRSHWSLKAYTRELRFFWAAKGRTFHMPGEGRFISVASAEGGSCSCLAADVPSRCSSAAMAGPRVFVRPRSRSGPAARELRARDPEKRPEPKPRKGGPGPGRPGPGPRPAQGFQKLKAPLWARALSLALEYDLPTDTQITVFA